MHLFLLLFLPGCPVQMKGGAEQTALPSLPHGPGHCVGSAEGRAPTIHSVELKAEYRILSVPLACGAGLSGPDRSVTLGYFQTTANTRFGRKISGLSGLS